MANTTTVGLSSFAAGIAAIMGTFIAYRSMTDSRDSSSAIIEELQRIRLRIEAANFSDQSVEEVNALLTEAADLEDTLVHRVQATPLETDAYISRVYEGVFEIKPDEYYELQTPSGKVIDLFYREHTTEKEVRTYIDGQRGFQSVGEKWTVGLSEEGCELTLVAESDLNDTATYRFRCSQAAE